MMRGMNVRVRVSVRLSVSERVGVRVLVSIQKSKCEGATARA